MTRMTNRRFVEKIFQQSSELSQLVTDLLDLSRLESGMATLSLESCESWRISGAPNESFRPGVR